MNFVNFILLLIFLIVWIGVLSTRHFPAGVKLFLTVVGIATLVTTGLIIFVNIYDKVNALIFFLLLFVLVAVGIFLAARGRRY